MKFKGLIVSGVLVGLVSVANADLECTRVSSGHNFFPKYVKLLEDENNVVKSIRGENCKEMNGKFLAYKCGNMELSITPEYVLKLRSFKKEVTYLCLPLSFWGRVSPSSFLYKKNIY